MTGRLYRYGPVNSHDVAKALALILMSIDHVGAYLFPDALDWRALGRLCVPIWFFLIGYAKSTQVSASLWVYALLLVGVNIATGHPVFPLNVLVSIMACRAVLQCCDARNLIMRYPAEIIGGCCALYLLSMPLFEYGSIAIGFAVLGRLVREQTHGLRLCALWVSLTVFYIGAQIISFSFDLAQSTFVTIGTMLVATMLYRFTLVPVTLPRAMQLPVLAMSRYSLEYYVLHKTVLQALGLALGVTALHFSWFDF